MTAVSQCHLTGVLGGANPRRRDRRSCLRVAVRPKSHAAQGTPVPRNTQVQAATNTSPFTRALGTGEVITPLSSAGRI